MLPTIRIFVSSPGDVDQERNAADRVIKRLKDRYASDAIIDPVIWEHEPMTANKSFQEQILSPAECDIVVIMLWARMGTRLPSSFAVDPEGNAYPSGTAYEFWTSFERYQKDGSPDILVYKKTSQYVPESDHADVLEKAAAQKRTLEEFMEKLLSEEGLPKHAYLTFEDVRRFEEILEVHLEKLLERKLFGEVTLNPTWQGNPFLGLHAFDLKHAPIFFGREVAIQRAAEQLKNRVAAGISSLLVVGASGSGKSSLVRSGLMSRIISSQPDLPHIVLRPGAASPDTPLGYLAQAIEEKIPKVKPFRIRELLEHNPAAVPHILSGIHESSDEEMASPKPQLLLIIDQLEELLTSGINVDQQRKFATAIDLLIRSGTCWCIATLRSDYYARLTEIPEFSHFTEESGVFNLQPPTKAEIGQMIRRPARAAGLYFEENRQTGQSLDDLIRDDAGDHTEILPLLEFTLDELYLHRTENGQLTFEAYNKLGGIEGSVSRRASEVFNKLTTKVQQSLPRVFRQLVTVSIEDAIPTRQRCLDAHFDDDPPARQLVNAFVEARLLSRDEQDGKPYVEIVHEALLKRWQPLVDWLRQEAELLRMRSRLMESFQRWETSGKRSDLLLPQGKALEEGEKVTGESNLISGNLGTHVAQFVRQSRNAVQRRKRLAMTAVLALALLAVVATGTGIAAISRGNDLKIAIADLEKTNIDLEQNKQDLQSAIDQTEQKSKEIAVISSDRLEQNVRMNLDLASQSLTRHEYTQAFAALQRAYTIDNDNAAFQKRQHVHQRLLGTLGSKMAELRHCIALQETVLASWLDHESEMVHLVTTSGPGKGMTIFFRSLQLDTFDVKVRHIFDLPQGVIVQRCDVAPSSKSFVLTTVEPRTQQQFDTTLRFFTTSDLSHSFNAPIDGMLFEMAFDQSGQYFCGLTSDGSNSNRRQGLVFVDLKKQQSTKSTPDEKGDAVSVAIQPGGDRVFLINGNGGVHSWTVKSKITDLTSIAERSQSIGLPIPALHMHAGKARLAIGGFNSVTMFSGANSEDGDLSWSDLKIPLSGKCTSIQFLNDGKLLAIASHDDADFYSLDSRDSGTSSVKIVSTDKGTTICPTFRGRTSNTSYSIHEQSGLIAFVRDRGNIEIRQFQETSTPLFLIASSPNETISQLEFSTNGNALIAITSEGSLLCWDLTRNVFGQPLKNQLPADTRLAVAGMRLPSIRESLLSKDLMNPVTDIPLSIGDSYITCINTMNSNGKNFQKNEDFSNVSVYAIPSMKRVGNRIKSSHSVEVADFHEAKKLLCLGYRSGIVTPMSRAQTIAELEAKLAAIPNRAEAAAIRILTFDDSWREITSISDLGADIVDCKFSHDGETLFLAVGTPEGRGELRSVDLSNMKRSQVIAAFNEPIWQMHVSQDSQWIAILTRGFGLSTFQKQGSDWKRVGQQNAVIAVTFSPESDRMAVSTISEEFIVRNLLTGKNESTKAPPVRTSADGTDVGFVLLLSWIAPDTLILVRDDGLVLTKNDAGDSHRFLAPSCRAAAIDGYGMLTTLHVNGEAQLRSIIPPPGGEMTFPPLKAGKIGTPIEVEVRSNKLGTTLISGNTQVWLPLVSCEDSEIGHSLKNIFFGHSNSSASHIRTDQLSQERFDVTRQSTLALASALRSDPKILDSDALALTNRVEKCDPALVPELFEQFIIYSRESRRFTEAEQAYRRVIQSMLKERSCPEIVDILSDGWSPFPNTVLEFIPLVKEKHAEFLASNNYFDVSTRTTLHFSEMGASVRAGDSKSAIKACQKFLSDTPAILLEKQRNGYGIPFAYEQLYFAARDGGEPKVAAESLSWIRNKISEGDIDLVARAGARIASHFKDLAEFRAFVIKHFEDQLSTNPTNPTLLGWLGKLYIRDGNAKIGIQYLEEAIQNTTSELRNGNEGHTLTTLNLYLAFAYAISGNSEEAEKILASAEQSHKKDIQNRDFAGKNSGDRRYEAIHKEIQLLLNKEQ